MRTLEGEQKSAQTTETYRLLAHLVHEHDVVHGEFQRQALGERQYAAAYLHANQEGEEAVAMRKLVGEGGRGWLEEQ